MIASSLVNIRSGNLEEDMKKKIIALAVAATFALSLAACRNASPAETTAAAETTHAAETTASETTAAVQTTAAAETTAAETQAAAEEDGQNPVMNFVGVDHTAVSVEAMVEAEGMENAKITITYAGSPWFHTQTVMSGRFDPETFTIEFADAARTEYTYKSDGSVAEENPVYTEGTGKAVFDPEENKFTLTEQIGAGEDETVYLWGPSSEMMYVTDPDHYGGVTAMDKFKVETEIGSAVRTAYLNSDWYTLADMIDYPITINGTELKDSDAFLDYMKDKTVANSDWNDMMDENLLDMFVNGQGLCMGSGQVWLNDPGYMTDKEPELKIIAISGIVDQDSEEAQIPEEEGDFYDNPSVTVYDEAGESHTLYESSDGYWREEDGTTYIKLSDTEFQLKDGGETLHVR